MDITTTLGYPVHMEQPTFKPLVMIILDGIGIAPSSQGNAVTTANPPYLQKAWDSYPHTYLQASQQYVGLPPGIKGNSEVGHMNLGSGRVVFQELPRIDRAIEKNTFSSNQVLVKAFEHAKQNNSRLHAAVCWSDAGVHGTIAHLEALLDMAAKLEFKQQLIIHAFTDGRDSPPKSAEQYFNRISEKIKQTGVGVIGTMMGRYYAMDRNESWDRIEKAYNALTSGQGITVNSWQEGLNQAYARNEIDEFIQPTVIANTDSTVKPNDAFILLNFRADRAVELTSAFLLPEFSYFKRSSVPANLYYVGMTEYAKGIPQNVAFPKENINLPFGRIISEAGMRQLRIAESEKFPHVTYFFNGGRSIKFDGEDRIEIPSPAVATYDMKPEMSAEEVTRVLLEKLSLRIYDFILVNFANGDMVGHTGVLEAGVKAISVVDSCVEKIVTEVNSVGGVAILTADHGNAEEMINQQTGEIDTEHSINPVPFIIVPPKALTTNLKLPSGVLADVSTTALSLLGLNKPSELSGENLFFQP